MSHSYIQNMYSGMPIPGTFGMMVDVLVDWPYTMYLQGTCVRDKTGSLHKKYLGGTWLGYGWYTCMFLLNHKVVGSTTHAMTVWLEDVWGYTRGYDAVDGVVVTHDPAAADMHDDDKEKYDWPPVPASAAGLIPVERPLPPWFPDYRDAPLYQTGFDTGFVTLDRKTTFSGTAPDDLTVTVSRVDRPLKPYLDAAGETRLARFAVRRGDEWRYEFDPANGKHKSELRFQFEKAGSDPATIGVALVTPDAEDVIVIARRKDYKLPAYLKKFPPKGKKGKRQK